jgi:hypothetical protein
LFNQVEQVKNVGQPAYTQLQDIRKQMNENVAVGATLPQAWEPRPTRMLELTLCDGVQSIKGIEYRPIMSLNEQLLPGCKVTVIIFTLQGMSSFSSLSCFCTVGQLLHWIFPTVSVFPFLHFINHPPVSSSPFYIS